MVLNSEMLYSSSTRMVLVSMTRDSSSTWAILATLASISSISSKIFEYEYCCYLFVWLVGIVTRSIWCRCHDELMHLMHRSQEEQKCHHPVSGIWRLVPTPIVWYSSSTRVLPVGTRSTDSNTRVLFVQHIVYSSSTQLVLDPFHTVLE